MRTPHDPTSPRQIAIAATLLLALSQAGMLESQARTPQGEPNAKTLAVKAVGKPIPMTDPSRNVIEHVLVSQKEQQTEVLVEGKSQLSCKPYRLSQPPRLVLDFPRATLRALPPAIPMGAHPLRDIRVSQFKDDVARVVIELDGQASYLCTAKENFITVVFGSPAAAIAAVAARDEKKSSFEGKAQTPQGEPKAKTLAVKAVAKPVKPLDTSIEQVRVIRKEGQTEVRVEGSGPLYCVPFVLKQPDRLVLDFPGTAMRIERPLIQGDVRPVRSVRFGQFKPAMARLVIDLDGQAPYTVASKENALSVIFSSGDGAVPAVAPKSEKKSYVVGSYVPATATPPPSPNQAQDKTEAKPSLGLSTNPAPVLGNSAAKDEKKPAVSGSFPSASAAPLSSPQSQSQVSTPSPAGLQSTREQSRPSIAPSSSLPQASESSSAKSVPLPQYAAVTPVATVKEEKKPSAIDPPAPEKLALPAPDQAHSRIEAKSSPELPIKPAPVFASPTPRDEKNPSAGGAFASATPAPSSSVQAQTKISTQSPAGFLPTSDQSRASVALSSSLPQANESSSAKPISLPPHAEGSPTTSDEKKSSPVSASAPPTPASTPPLDPAPSKIEGRSSLGLHAPPATVPPSSPAASDAISSTPSSVELSPTRAGSPSSVAPSATLPQPSEHSTVSPSLYQNDSYVLGPLDVVAINVWRDPELSRVEPVRPDGKISLPLIGDMQASGLTPKMLQIQITKALGDYVRKPEVTVILQEANSHRFNLIGEVARPGSYLLAANMTVLDALAAAGGFRDFAKVTKIYVLRKMPNGSSERISFNYKKAIKGSGDMNLQLLPGDTIVVP